MKKMLVLLAAGIGSLAFWRRKTLKDDVGRVKETGTETVAKVKDRRSSAEDTTDSDELIGDGVADIDVAEASDETAEPEKAATT